MKYKIETNYVPFKFFIIHKNYFDYLFNALRKNILTERHRDCEKGGRANESKVELYRINNENYKTGLDS
ncbi:Hypothetical protein IALB_3137 [Ignavibacterium album JCM 16511]|uniref:Uncharacterized protein n=1 Tax=Ignavibacterium album (strain DSM 19864 / JCM 16511 / NBRC 101810 / Mat9-16) TaxID=945713 RepID=I0APD3_IGNAJ|nr:Hypothetical protein IALB_3137 [Ignavibacterium album JCM 16511]